MNRVLVEILEFAVYLAGTAVAVAAFVLIAGLVSYRRRNR